MLEPGNSPGSRVSGNVTLALLILALVALVVAILALVESLATYRGAVCLEAQIGELKRMTVRPVYTNPHLRREIWPRGGCPP